MAGSTSNGLDNPSSSPISLTAGRTSSPMSLRLRIWSSWDMAPSPSQKKTLPGLKYSRTSLILGMTVLGVPVMMVLSPTQWSVNGSLEDLSIVRY